MKRPHVKAIARYLGSRANALDFEQVRDPRARRGRRWSLRSLLMATLIGMVALEQSFRGVERVTDKLSGCRKRLGISRRVPDSTLARLYSRLDDEAGVRDVLIQDIKRAGRRKALEPTELPLTAAAIDGKTVWCDSFEVDDPACQAMPQEAQGYYRLHALHAVLISVAAQPCVDQLLVPKETNEMAALPQLIENLVAAYGKSFIEVVSVDAGMTSAHNANVITTNEMRYVMAVKGTQPSLLAETKRLCGWGSHKQVGYVREAATPWERYRGNRVRRELFRSGEIKGWPGWASARQVWRIKQTTEKPSGEVEVENRYFVTSLPWDRLTSHQILQLVRLHWGVENGCHWTMDVVLGEDDRPWCTKGRALRMLSWLRLHAYNALRFLRDRYLRSEKSRRLPWTELGADIMHALTHSGAWRAAGSAEAATTTV